MPTTVPCHTYPSAVFSTRERRTLMVVVASRESIRSEPGCAASGACMPLVSSYSMTLGSGSAIIAMPMAAFELMASCIMALCFGVMGVAGSIGSKARFDLSSSSMTETPCSAAARLSASSRSSGTDHISAPVISSGSPDGSPAARLRAAIAGASGRRQMGKDETARSIGPHAVDREGQRHADERCSEKGGAQRAHVLDKPAWHPRSCAE